MLVGEWSLYAAQVTDAIDGAFRHPEWSSRSDARRVDQVKCHVVSILNLVGYTRCSLIEQSTDGLSLEAQRSRIVAYCEAVGAVLRGCIEDAGVSGSRPLVERPGGQEIVSLLDQRKPAVDAVVIVRLDRLGRDAAETLHYLRRFSRGSVGLISIADRIDLGSPQGRAMASMSAVFSELERELIAQRTSDALAELRRQGRSYGRAPFGWDAVDGLLVQNPDEQKVLKYMRGLRKRGLGYERVAQRLNARGTPCKRGGRWWAMSARSVLLTSQRLLDLPVRATDGVGV
jgi:DNA invertase Pin-like site-specific DNA recombinase